jgi:outer membrane receptor protein involved in Fe transport
VTQVTRPANTIRSKGSVIMSETSRRRFIGVAGAGAAVAGATALVPGAATAAQTRLREKGARSPVVAYVSDIDSDEVTLMVEEREVVLHDRDLVIRLRNAAGR